MTKTLETNGIREAFQNEPRKSASTWFAVVDAAQDSTFLFLHAGAIVRRQSLYAGELGAMLDDVAPHLVEFQLDSEFAGWIAERWAANCGIVLRSDASFDEMRKHLRRFLLVKNEAGKRYRFRFYDPRVLRTFVPSCTLAEALEFFGPAGCIYAADPTAAHVLRFTCGRAGVEFNPLSASAARRTE